MVQTRRGSMLARQACQTHQTPQSPQQAPLAEGRPERLFTNSSTPGEMDAFWSEPSSYSSRYWNLETGLPNNPEHRTKTPIHTSGAGEQQPAPDLQKGYFQEFTTLSPGGKPKIQPSEDGPYIPEIYIDENGMKSTSQLDRLPGSPYTYDQPSHQGGGPTVDPTMLHVHHTPLYDIDDEPGMPPRQSVYPDPELYGANTARFYRPEAPAMPENDGNKQKTASKRSRKRKAGAGQDEEQGIDMVTSDVVTSDVAFPKPALPGQALPGRVLFANSWDDHPAKKTRQESPEQANIRKVDPRLLALFQKDTEKSTSKGALNNRGPRKYRQSTTPIPLPKIGIFPAPSSVNQAGTGHKAPLPLGGAHQKKPQASKVRFRIVNKQYLGQNSFQMQPSPLAGLQPLGQNNLLSSQAAASHRFDTRTFLPREDSGQETQMKPALPYANPQIANSGLNGVESLTTRTPRGEALYVGKPKAAWVVLSYNQTLRARAAARGVAINTSEGSDTEDDDDDDDDDDEVQLQSQQQSKKGKKKKKVNGKHISSTGTDEKKVASTPTLPYKQLLEPLPAPSVYAALFEANGIVDVHFYATEPGIPKPQAGVEIGLADIEFNDLFKGMDHPVIRHWCRELLVDPSHAAKNLQGFLRTSPRG